MISLHFSLPYPPSVNHYWSTTSRGRMYVSRRGKDYRTASAIALLMQRVPRDGIAGPLRVSLVANPPDRKRRDLDNVLKALLDAIVAANVIEDDSNIHDLRIVRGSVVPGGSVAVHIHAESSETELARRSAPLEP
jgi:crossover junction endodeoxyribonuclease RusA